MLESPKPPNFSRFHRYSNSMTIKESRFRGGGGGGCQRICLIHGAVETAVMVVVVIRLLRFHDPLQKPFLPVVLVHILQIQTNLEAHYSWVLSQMPSMSLTESLSWELG